MSMDMASIKRRDSYIVKVEDLLRAVNEDDTEKAQHLLHSGICNVNWADPTGATALHFACRSGNVDTLRCLLAFDPDVDAVTKDGTSPLMYCALHNNIAGMKLLLEMDANPNVADSKGHSPLYHATRLKHCECMTLLLEAGVLCDWPTLMQYIALKSWRKCLKILLETDEKARLSGERDEIDMCIRTLVSGSGDVNARDSSGYTALMFAAENGHPCCVEALLQCGAQPDIRNEEGETALLLAIPHCVYCVKLLLEAQADVEVCHPLIKAAATCTDDTIVRLLIDRGADVNAAYSDGYDSPLMAAVKAGNARFVKVLLDHGADPNAGTKGMVRGLNLTPLTQALEDPICLDVVKALVNAGADVNLTGKYGLQPVFLTLQKGGANALKFLLDKGASINATDLWSATVLKRSISNNLVEHVKVCIDDVTNWKENVSRNSLCESGVVVPDVRVHMEAISQAIVRGDKYAIQLFLRYGAQPAMYPFHASQPHNKVENLDEIFSFLALAIMLNNSDIARFFIANLFLVPSDLKCAYFFHKYSGFDNLRAVYSRPWSLRSLSFLALSSAFGFSDNRVDRVLNSGLSDQLQQKLLFKTLNTGTPVDEWSSISLDHI
ncbi:ankyrin-1 [Aplysia californica]|uniref:Ankyrin-1 n=1 Tax=Aplysia californica TaxID=6500 RepID=A0ABM0JIJ0_APLCA|nr:ankyrin-1 [Aplysia californica]